MLHFRNFILRLILFSLSFYTAQNYLVRNHPCCQEPSENLTLAMVIDAYEIYGHDPTDKLDHLAHYQIEMMKIKRAPDQYIINEHIHIATDHLQRFITLHIKELKARLYISIIEICSFIKPMIDWLLNQRFLSGDFPSSMGSGPGDKLVQWCHGAPEPCVPFNGQVLLIAMDDTIDNMLTMYDNHNAIKTERVATYNQAAGGAVPSEFYLSQEYYCAKNVYIFISELYSDIYNMGRGKEPYCQGRAFHFLGFVHFLDDTHYYLEEDPTVAFQMDNYIHGLECHNGFCIFRFPFKKNLQHIRDVSTLPKAIVKCGTETYKLPPLTAASCIITSGSFILDFNIQGLRFRHHDYLLTVPNGETYYTKEKHTPLVCDHHVCEWNYTNFYGGPFIIPGDPEEGYLVPVPPYVEHTEPPRDVTPDPNGPGGLEENITYVLDGCWFMFPPNYGSIAGVSYLDPLSVHEYRYTCSGAGNKGLYWYPQWMGAPPHHPYPQSIDSPTDLSQGMPGPYYPHQQISIPDALKLPQMPKMEPNP